MDVPPILLNGHAVHRTPDARFACLPGYAYTPRYVSDLPGFAGLRMHYVDEGPAHADVTVLCLHGQPTWGYLYRKMAPVFLAAGQRVVIPDLFGFGRSDKPEDESFYTFSAHRQMLLAFIRTLDLKDITLVVQDWGGLIGLTLAHEEPSRFARLLVMNTMLGTGDRALSTGFLAWRDFANAHPDLNVAGLMQRAVPALSPDEAAAYGLPFPDLASKAGVRRFPNLVPDHPDADGAAVSRIAREFLGRHWEGQSFMAIGMRDPVLGPAVMHDLHHHIQGCPPPMEVDEGGHFLQEWGAPIAAAALASWGQA